MRRFLFVALVAAAAPAYAGDKPAPAAKTAPKPAAKPAPPKKSVVVTPEHKKALADYCYGGFKFGMSKDEVVAMLSKQLDERYADKLKATTDVRLQDRLRAEKRDELSRVSKSYIEFNGKGASGWDVSIIEDEFAHNTGESMLERWENKDGKNQRRFFFFKDGKLWKMFLQLDVSILPADKKNFDTFSGIMQAKFGPGDVDGGVIAWRTDEFEAKAIDKLRLYDAVGISIADPRVQKDLFALRESKAPKKAETSAVIKAVLDTDGNDHPDVKNGGSSAVDAVINAQGGGGPSTKTAPAPKAPPSSKK